MVIVSRVSMLSICRETGCSTIVFGDGTCVEHDERYSTGVDTSPSEATAGSEEHAAVAEAPSPVA